MSDITLVIPPNVEPTQLEVAVHAVHYTEMGQFGAYLRIHGDLGVIVNEENGSIHLFFPPDAFKHLLKNLLDVLIFTLPSEEEIIDVTPAE